MMDFTCRSDVGEHLDEPNLDRESYRKAYLDINRCNTLLGGTAITLKAIRKLMNNHPKESYTIFDMGCGDGHMLRSIADAFENEAVALRLVGIDLEEEIVNIAREASSSYTSIQFKKADILTMDRIEGCDILLCTLTMHHFKEKDILKFIKKFSELARLGIIINDLERSKLAYYLFKIFSFFFVKSTIAKEDGLTSIQKGFRKPELRQMATQFKDLRHTIEWKWAFRFLWVMEPNQSM